MRINEITNKNEPLIQGKVKKIVGNKVEIEQSPGVSTTVDTSTVDIKDTPSGVELSDKKTNSTKSSGSTIKPGQKATYKSNENK